MRLSLRSYGSRPHTCINLKSTNKAEANRRSASLSFPNRLLEGGRNAAEGILQVGAEALHDRDDRNRDAGGDKAIFNGGRCRFVLEKGRNEILHCKLLLVPHGDPDRQIVID